MRHTDAFSHAFSNSIDKVTKFLFIISLQKVSQLGKISQVEINVLYHFYDEARGMYYRVPRHENAMETTWWRKNYFPFQVAAHWTHSGKFWTLFVDVLHYIPIEVEHTASKFIQIIIIYLFILIQFLRTYKRAWDTWIQFNACLWKINAAYILLIQKIYINHFKYPMKLIFTCNNWIQASSLSDLGDFGNFSVRMCGPKN